jgi:hypothetical protein
MPIMPSASQLSNPKSRAGSATSMSWRSSSGGTSDSSVMTKMVIKLSAIRP